MYLENYYYVKSCSFIIDKLWNKSKFKIFYSLGKLNLNYITTDYKKYKIISFLIFNYLNVSLENSITNKLSILSLKSNYEIFSFISALILVWLPASLNTNFVSFLDISNDKQFKWDLKHLFMFMELEKLLAFMDNPTIIFKNFTLQVTFIKYFDSINYKEMFFRTLKFPVIQK